MSTQTHGTDSSAFLTKLSELMPEMVSNFDDVITPDMNLDEINESAFRKSEYLGGISAVIISLIKAEL